jgi:quercetin dioxygenase-like cupin family protein
VASHIIRVQDRPNLEAEIDRPGAPASAERQGKSTRFLGAPGEDFVDPKQPPYAYLIERPKGDITPDHAHNAGRTEYVLEGEIEWREPGKEPKVYGAGTLTYVEAGTVYGYSVLEDAKILILFDSPPGMNYR